MASSTIIGAGSPGATVDQPGSSPEEEPSGDLAGFRLRRAATTSNISRLLSNSWPIAAVDRKVLKVSTEKDRKEGRRVWEAFDKRSKNVWKARLSSLKAF